MDSPTNNRSLHALDWLNFFLADVQTGVGPFLAIYLSASHWNPQQVGVVLTCGGLVGVVAQAPAGALVDATHHKRTLLVVGLAVLSAASLALAFHPSFWWVTASQVALGLVGAVLAPTVAAMTLGMVSSEEFDRRFGRNQTFNAAGNVAAALLMGLVGYTISNRAIFLVVPLLALPCIFAIKAIQSRDIDYAQSRGACADDAVPAPVRDFLKNRPLLAFIGCAVLFHFANAAMLPQLGEMLAHGRAKVSAPFMSACVIVTQLVITLTASWLGAKASVWGRKPLLLVGFGVLPLRGLLYTLTASVPLLVGIQVLDGIANAIFGVVSVLVIADLTRGSGRFNVTQGVLAGAVGIGASLSNAFGGFIAQRYGFAASFLTLAGVALAAWILLWATVPETLAREGGQEESRHLSAA